MVMMPEHPFSVQEWLAHRIIPTPNNKGVRYAMWWINRALEPSSLRVRFLDFDGGHELYVTYRGERYRVIGINRFSELTLTSLQSATPDEPKRVRMYREADFTEWSNTAEGPLDNSKFVPLQ